MSESLKSWGNFLLKVGCVSILFFVSLYLVLETILDVINTKFVNPLIAEKSLMVVTHTEMTIFLAKAYGIIGLISFVIIFAILLKAQVQK